MDIRYFPPILVCILLCMAGIFSTASAEDTRSLMINGNESSPYATGTSQVADLIDFVNEAKVYAERVGKSVALKEFSQQNGSFTRGDLYIWAYDFNGVNLAHPWHPEYTGENKLSLTDSTGFHMIEAMQNEARNGSGFVTYQFDNPVTGETEPKLAYTKRVDDTWWLASGVYGGSFNISDKAPESIRDTLKSRVDEAISYARDVGKEDALKTFNNQSGQFATDGSYIFAFDMNGTTLAMPYHPDMIGVNQGNLTDVNGVSIGGEKLMVAHDGGGFWYYVFDNPDAGKKPEFKVSYISPVDDHWVIGTGVYLPEIPVHFSADNRENLVSRVHEAAAYVKKNGRDKAIKEFNDPNGSFSDPDLFVFAFDTNGTLLANPYLPGLVGVNRLNDRDPYGKYPVRQLIDNAENGGGFTYYFFADPGSDFAIRLKLGYSEIADDNLTVGSGIFPDE